MRSFAIVIRRAYFEAKKRRKYAKNVVVIKSGLLTGMHRNGPEWTSITGMDLKIYPKIHVLSVLAEKFWFSNVKYQIP